MERVLYEASLSGNLDTLNSLIKTDQLLLDKISLTFFHETPLHIAALRGHLNFVRALLSHKPKLATVLDSFQRSPLHLACAEGCVEIVKELINIHPQVCRVRDQDGRIPLHLAAMNQEIDVMKILMQEQPELARETLEHGETILHLCVKYNRFKALNFFVELWGDDEFICSQDDSGNTILHLAVVLKQMENIKYLLSNRGINANANAMNANGFTALDVLEHYPRDFKVLEIRQVLVEHGIQRAKDLKSTPLPSSLVTVSTSTINEELNISKSRPNKAMRLISKMWKAYFKSDSTWLEEARGNLMVAATVTATMTFQAGLNPPGGVWQDSEKNKKLTWAEYELTDKYYNTTAGYSVAATIFPNLYNLFLGCNTVSLIASLSTILLMISGVPLRNKFITWLLMMTMCTTIVFIVLTYMFSIIIVTADETLDATAKLCETSIRTWIGLCLVVILLHTPRFFVWLVRKLRKFLRKNPSHEGDCQGSYIHGIKNNCVSYTK